MDDVLSQSCEKSTPSVSRRHSLKMEECLINGEKIKLPQALCENTELFQALFSVDSWNAFTEQQRRHLMQFLPNFGENDIEEKSYTLKRLFSSSNFRFGSNPLNEFCEKLNAGFYRADIVEMQKLLTKARYKQYLKRQRVYYYKVLKHCLLKRQKLLESASDLQLGSTLPSVPQNSNAASVKRKLDRISLEKRVKHRYFQELISIKKELGDSSDSSFDENYPEGFVPPPFTKKHRKQICVLEESFNSEFEQPIISTLSRPDCLDLSRLVLNVDNPFNMTEDKYKEMLKNFNKHQRNLQPLLKIQKKNKPNKHLVNSKLSKEMKPLRKRRPRKPQTAAKPIAKESLEVSKDPLLITPDFVKPAPSTFNFPKLEPSDSKFDKIQIKQEEELESFIACNTKSNLLLDDHDILIKEEMAMKEEQDNAVAALLKQEEDDGRGDRYIKTEEKPSVLMFEEFDHHEDDMNTDKTSSEYLITPDSYSVALHSVVNNSPSFKKTIDESEKTINEAASISEVESMTFDSLSIDTMAETPFTNSSSVISTGGNTPTMARISPSVTDLDSMNVMDLGPLNAEDTEPPPTRDKPPAELIHNAHSSFFSLIREIVCSTWDHRMDLRNLQKRVNMWYDNAVSPLNSWYTNESWPDLLQNAVTFLAGQCPDDLLPPDYVPYIDYKASLDIYQWIGAGRDSDAKLTLLCEMWLKNKEQVAARVVEDASLLPFILPDEYEFKREQRSVSPASTRFPTDWVVKSSTFEEKEDFRKQEKLRFQNPNVAFVYRIHGYQTVVGPVNMNHVLPNHSKTVKGSSLLVENRPYYITILSLVQDAAARLPNGEGTRQDIVTLLKDSQYLSQNIMNCILHGAVTFSLEQLQQESDPCVKYDARRKIWIYLHRSRTINDFETMETTKPKNTRKTAVWKFKKDQTSTSVVSVTSKVDGVAAARPVKEPKPNARVAKNTNIAKSIENKTNTKRTPANARNTKEDKSKLQPTVIQTVISDSKLGQSIEAVVAGSGGTVAINHPDIESQIINVHPATAENTRNVVRTADIKNTIKQSPKTTRPSIIKKAIVKEAAPISSIASAVKPNTTEGKSILTGSNVLSTNTIVKLINAKTLTTDAVKGAKTIAQISPQQIVVIKQAEDTISPDKKHTVLLKQVQMSPNQHRLTLANVQKAQRQTQTDQQCSGQANLNRQGIVATETIDGPKQDLFEKHQKQLQQLLAKHQSELKQQQQQQSGVKEAPTVTVQQGKMLPKQMIVIKQNQGQVISETPVVEDEQGLSAQKQISSPLVILNKQQYQQQLQNPKHQIIQLSGQQLTAQQLQQMFLKQQQTLKRVSQQQQPQQIVMLKSDVQQQGQQQIVMLKQPNQPQPPQQLVMIKQPAHSAQKIQQKPQQSQPQIIQITNSGSIVSPISADLSKLQATTSSPQTQIPKIQTSIPPTVIQNTKTASVIGTGTTISVSAAKQSLPAYAVVALGQQSKIFSQNNQNLQILTPATGTINNNQTVVLPTSSGALTLLQQGSMQQVLLPSGFNAPGMINLKTLQGLKVIPISTQNANALKGQSVITRLVNSNAIRPVVIQEDRSSSSPSNTNIPHQ